MVYVELGSLLICPFKSVHTDSIIEVQFITDAAGSGKLGLTGSLAGRAFQFQRRLSNLGSKPLTSKQGAKPFRAGMT